MLEGELTAPMLEREKVPPEISAGERAPFNPSSCNLFSSTAMSKTDLSCRVEMDHYSPFVCDLYTKFLSYYY